MLGYGLKNILARYGTWISIFVSPFTKTEWQNIVWTASVPTTPAGSKLEIRFKSATTAEGLDTADWSDYSTSSLLSLINISINHQYLKFEARLSAYYPDIAAALPSLNSLIINFKDAGY